MSNRLQTQVVERRAVGWARLDSMTTLSFSQIHLNARLFSCSQTGQPNKKIEGMSAFDCK